MPSDISVRDCQPSSVRHHPRHHSVPVPWSPLTFRGRPRVLSACTLQGQACTQGEACSLIPHPLNEDFRVQGNPLASSPLLPGHLGQELAVC